MQKSFLIPTIDHYNFIDIDKPEHATLGVGLASKFLQQKTGHILLRLSNKIRRVLSKLVYLDYPLFCRPHPTNLPTNITL